MRSNVMIRVNVWVVVLKLKGEDSVRPIFCYSREEAREAFLHQAEQLRRAGGRQMYAEPGVIHTSEGWIMTEEIYDPRAGTSAELLVYPNAHMREVRWADVKSRNQRRAA